MNVNSRDDVEPGLQATVGEIIRQQRQLAELPMRQLAAMVGISNPYLSQIENNLRAPSTQVLNSIAVSLGLDPEELKVAATDKDDDLRAAIRADSRLTPAQRRALEEVYAAMLAANRADPTR